MEMVNISQSREKNIINPNIPTFPFNDYQQSAILVLPILYPTHSNFYFVLLEHFKASLHAQDFI